MRVLCPVIFSAKGGAALGERKFCYKCMERYDAELTVCPSCGYDENTPHNPMYIAPGTILHDRYLVGILQDFNGEGATYVCHDMSTDCRVLIREYMPVHLCTRVKNKATISVNYNDLALYKSFMAEYTEMNKHLARLRNNSNINPILDMFAENNTTYTVYEYIDGVKMLDYLKDNAGEISWEQLAKIFPPLLTTIGILHNAGIIHRAISPDTVYINDKGELKLTAFCISSARTVDAGLEYELFKGYAAPEQYSSATSSRQGSWTDIYGICALMYRALTGCMPVDSLSRLKHDDLCAPHMLNSRIPEHVSNVIMQGMNPSGQDRIQTITELVTKLFEQPAVSRPVQPVQQMQPEQRVYRESYPDQMDRQPVRYQGPPPQEYYPDPQRNGGYRYERVNTVDKIKVPIIIGVLLIAILMIIGVFVFNAMSGVGDDSDELNGRSSSSTDNVVSDDPEDEENTEISDTIIPDLVGKFYDYTEENYKDYFKFEAIYEYNDDYEVDMIFWQNYDPGEQVAAGTTIRVKVSKGKESAEIPEYEGMTITQYEKELKKAGISNYSKIATSAAYYGEPNDVVQLQVEGKVVYPGSVFSNKEGKKLIVYYITDDADIIGGFDPNQNIYIDDGGESQTTTQYQYIPPATTAPAYVEPVTQAPEPVTQAPEPVTQAPEPVTQAPPVDPPTQAQGGEDPNVPPSW